MVLHDRTTFIWDIFMYICNNVHFKIYNLIMVTEIMFILLTLEKKITEKLNSDILVYFTTHLLKQWG